MGCPFPATARKPRRARLRCAAALAVTSGFAVGAHAHGFGQRYDLPVPLWLYLTGAAAAVALSFVVMAVFVKHASRLMDYPRTNLLRWSGGRAISHPLLLAGSRIASVILLLLVLVAGFFGNQTPVKNLAPLMVWAIWWVGMAYLSALLGDVWALINPVNTVFTWMEGAYSRLQRGARLSMGLRYPPALGAWPATLLLFAFAWSELIWEGSDIPANVAAVVLAYCVLTWSGMLVYGRDTWLRNGDAFSLVFGLFARFAPLEVRGPPAAPEWNLRPYAVGLLIDEPVQPSTLALVTLMLATVSFDGFIETPPWVDIVENLGGLLSPHPLALTADTSHAVVHTLGLCAAWLLFALIYLACAWSSARWAAAAAPREKTMHTMRIACLFVLTLVPIAIAYHLAHYLSFLLMACQYLVPLLSDPFGFGWDLFGTTLYMVKIGVVDAQFIWYTSVIAIVAGHIAAVYLAHVMAMRVYADKLAALRSQYPILLLMIGYTMVSLWIIAQPIVTSRFG